MFDRCYLLSPLHIDKGGANRLPRNIKSKPFIDILNRLEQLEFLADKNIWLELRKIRHNIAHQYEDEPKQTANALNAIYEAKPVLESIYRLLKIRFLAVRDNI